MRVVQMTLDEDLVRQVDRVAKRLKTSRSAFARQALRDAVERVGVARLEQEHRKGYERRPVGESEFGPWEAEQDWGDE